MGTVASWTTGDPYHVGEAIGDATPAGLFHVIAGTGSGGQTSGPALPAAYPAPGPAPNLPAGSTRPNSDGSSWVWNGKSWDLKQSPGGAAGPAQTAPPTSGTTSATAPGWSGTWVGGAAPAPGTPTTNPDGSWVGAPNYNLSTQAVTALKAQPGQAQPSASTFPSPTYTPYTPPSTPPRTADSGITPEINNMLTSYQSRPASGIAPVTVGSPQQSQASYSTAPTLGATQQANATNATAAQVGPAERASASLAQAAQLGPSAQAAAQQANASLAGQTTIDQSQSNQTRGQQQTSLADLFSASRGLTPSAAELQLRQTTDRNVANQLALASALQGRSVGGALKQASDASGQLNAQAAADSAVLRAQEQAQARNAYSQALSGVRGQDIGVAESQAGLTQGVNLANAQNLTGVSQSNAALGTGVSQSNAALKNAQDQQRAAFQQATSLANAQALTGTSQFNAGQGNQLTAEQAQLANAVAMQNANNQTGVSQFNAGQGNQMTQYQAGLQSASALQNAQLGTQNSQFNAGQANTLIGQQATIDQQTAIDNVANQLKARGLDDAQIQAYLAAMVQSKGQDLSAATTQRGQDITAMTSKYLADTQAKTAAATLSWAKTQGYASMAGALLAGAPGIIDALKSSWQKMFPGVSYPGDQQAAAQIDQSANITSSNFGSASVDGQDTTPGSDPNSGGTTGVADGNT